MTIRGLLVAGGVVSAVCVACAGATGGAAADGGSSGAAAQSCGELADSARQEVDAVLQAHRACTTASDCEGVGFSASCFDSCARALRKDGAAAFKAAQDKVDKAQCAQFAKQGCKLTIPPCAPPSAVACVSGVCTN